jgi:hypothetical protein
MHGGEISGNEARTEGGGVHVYYNGTFRIATGTVYGLNEESVHLRNTAPKGAALHVLSWVNNPLPQYGRSVGSNWIRNGDLNDSDNTIRVVNGAIQAAPPPRLPAPAPETATSGAASEGRRRASASTGATASKTIARGTILSVSLSDELSTDTHRAGDPWEGSLAQAVTIGDEVVWPAGTSVRGIVSQSAPIGRLSTGGGALAIKLTSIGGSSVNGGTYAVRADSKAIGANAALGAIAGALSGKKKLGEALSGAAKGAAAGAGAAAKSADTVKIPAGTYEFTIPENQAVAAGNS